MGNPMLSLIAPNTSKPNRFDFTESEKNTDDKYNLDMAKWVINNANNAKYQDHINRLLICRNFYLNKQWFLDEDTEAFLKDDDGQDTNRLRVTMNYIQQMGNMFRGNVNKMDFYGKVKSYSPNVKTRKDAQLEKLLYYADVAKQNESLGSYIKKNLPIGADETETRQIFQNVYKDNLVRAMNDLLNYGINVNRFDRVKMELAEDMFCSGIVVMKPKCYGGEYVFDRVMAERFFFDRSCIRPDLSDAMYMGEWHKMLPTEIYERFPSIGQGQRNEIEKWVAALSTTSVSDTAFDMNGRIPVFEVYWRDCNEFVYGYVLDEFGQQILERINYIEEGDIKAKYTEKDLVKNKDLDKYQRTVLKIKPNDKKKNTSKLVPDYWRYCFFIPQTYTGMPNVINTKFGGDIVLDKGILEYAEPNLYSPTNMKPPYKVNQYIYIDGETVSPTDIAINPQRMINRFLSVFENQVNNSGGSNIIYDPDMVDNELEFLDNVKRSEPASIRTKGMPIQNVVGRYDNSIGAGAASLYNYATLFKQNMEQITGISDAVKGQANNESLVGVMQLQIQRGALLQEPFYAAIENCFLDCFQSIVTAGKRFYLDNRRQLIIAVGEEETTVLEMTEEMRWEDFLVTVKRSTDPEKERIATDTLILQYVQFGLLSDIMAANLIGRGNAEELAMAVRDYAKQKLEMQRMAAQQQQAAIAQQQQGMQEGQMAAAKEQKDKTDVMMNKKDDQQHQMDMVILQKSLENKVQPKETVK